MSKIYFDNAATTPISNDVVDIMTQVMKNNFGNPSSTHSFGRESRAIIELTRKNISVGSYSELKSFFLKNL